ncbi:MAG: tRNA 2-thiouridine(34) synthase MnmA [Candidatus Omnitrophica bacterium]|nr:tRNA 2-thiouridine(34) synthase MnmA [Candidatus Omnitrophota bacterium]
MTGAQTRYFLWQDAVQENARPGFLTSLIKLNMNNKFQTIAVGMSGGVDSTVAAYLLKEEGHKVIGITMKIWDNSFAVNGPLRSGCYGPGEEKDIEEAQKAAKRLGIPYYVVGLEEEYKNSVLTYFREEYLCGKTPNPCAICNQKIKFGLLLDKAQQSGIKFDSFATGHYVRAEFDSTSSRYLLKKGLDQKKDQSYFLYRLNQGQLKKVCFPLGKYSKQEIKDLAEKIGFKDFVEKPESQDFFEGSDYSVFFKDQQILPGDIVDLSGKVVGRHEGLIHYTIGQRKGLNLGGLKEPVYVIRIDSCHNQIVVGLKENLLSDSLLVNELNWISIPEITSKIKAYAKIRSQHIEQPCTIIPFNSNRVKVEFDQPQMSITPGQSIVFYDGDSVMGGGIIDKAGIE